MSVGKTTVLNMSSADRVMVYLQVRVMVSVGETTVLNMTFAWDNSYSQVRVMVSVGKTTVLNMTFV